jgi:hypothetical protein
MASSVPVSPAGRTDAETVTHHRPPPRTCGADGRGGVSSRRFACRGRTACSSISRSTPPWRAQWGEVPAYAQSLRELLGDHGLSTLVEQVRCHQDKMAALARRVFAAWLEHVVGLTPPVAA